MSEFDLAGWLAAHPKPEYLTFSDALWQAEGKVVQHPRVRYELWQAQQAMPAANAEELARRAVVKVVEAERYLAGITRSPHTVHPGTQAALHAADTQWELDLATAIVDWYAPVVCWTREDYGRFHDAVLAMHCTCDAGADHERPWEAWAVTAGTLAKTLQYFWERATSSVSAPSEGPPL